MYVTWHNTLHIFRTSFTNFFLFLSQNDGGSINKTKNLVNASIKNHTALKDDSLHDFQHKSRWTTCRLTSKPLCLPVVSDYKGNLLNKESVLEWLLTPDREDYSQRQIEMFQHIKQLKDVVELHNIVQNLETGEFKCEIGDEILGSGRGKFTYLAKCGDVFPYKLLQETKNEAKCPSCQKVFKSKDIVTLNPNCKDEQDALEERIKLLTAKGLTHSGRPIARKKRIHEPSSTVCDSKKKKSRVKT